MITRLNALIQAASISLLLILVPGIASSQDQNAPAAPKAESPAAEQAQQPGPQTAPIEQPAEAPEAVSPASSQNEPVETYTIKQGDTLWDIANAFFKDPFLWPFIWKANPDITNPDLIFAGSKLAIPNLAPLERAMQAQAETAPVEQLVEKQVPAREKTPEEAAPPAPQPKPSEGIAAARTTSPKPTQPAPTVEGGESLVLPEEQPVPIIDKYAMLSAGFVNDVETADTIAGLAESEKTTASYDDIVYVRIDSRENVKIGDKFLIYAAQDGVRHPKTGERAGRVVRGLGILQITAKDPEAEVLTARITLSFDIIERGNFLTPYQEPALVFQSSQKKAKDISGYVLAVTDGRSINGQSDFVYLDRGSADGVDPGDRFTVYAEPAQRGFPKKEIGEVQVFLVKERTSTAIVRNSRESLGKGNIVDYKK